MLRIWPANDYLIRVKLSDDPAALELITYLDAHGGTLSTKTEGRKKIGKKAIMK